MVERRHQSGFVVLLLVIANIFWFYAAVLLQKVLEVSSAPCTAFLSFCPVYSTHMFRRMSCICAACGALLVLWQVFCLFVSFLNLYFPFVDYITLLGKVVGTAIT